MEIQGKVVSEHCSPSSWTRLSVPSAFQRPSLVRGAACVQFLLLGYKQGVIARVSDLSIQEAEARNIASSRPVWTT